MANDDQAQKPLLLLPAPKVAPTGIAGMVFLVLIFFASAGLTVAYLSNTSTRKAAQAAAVASAVVEDAFAGIKLEAQSAYVLDLTTDRVLYSKNEAAQLPLASLTKVPLALVIAEVIPPDTIITIAPHTPSDGGGVRLPAGLQFRAQDLIDFTLVASSNEGAEILAEAAASAMLQEYPGAAHAAPVLWRMNDWVKDLGLAHTYFLNTSGLDLSPTQAGAYGSAKDVARMFGYAASVYYATFGQTSRDTIKIRAITGESITARNTDEALPSIPGLILGKTGYTQLAGGNLAIVFEVGPAHPIAAVVLHSTRDGRFDDMKALITATISSIAGGGQ